MKNIFYLLLLVHPVFSTGQNTNNNADNVKLNQIAEE